MHLQETLYNALLDFLEAEPFRTPLGRHLHERAIKSDSSELIDESHPLMPYLKTAEL